MSILVTDQGFGPVPATLCVSLAEIDTHQGAVDLAQTDAPEALIPHLAALHTIRIAIPGFSDGRAFTLARRLRALGFTGSLRAHGPMIADQYPMARRVGFDAVEIPDEIAARQPEAQWLARANWQTGDYQSRLRA